MGPLILAIIVDNIIMLHVFIFGRLLTVHVKVCPEGAHVTAKYVTVTVIYESDQAQPDKRKCEHCANCTKI